MVVEACMRNGLESLVLRMPCLIDERVEDLGKDLDSIKAALIPVSDTIVVGGEASREARVQTKELGLRKA